MPDDALDAGACPACGFPLDGAIAFAPPQSRASRWLLLLTVPLCALAGYAGYAVRTNLTPTAPESQQTQEVARAPEVPRVPPPIEIAPFPHEPVNRDLPPEPPEPPVTVPKKDNPLEPKKEPEPKKDAPPANAVVIKIDPFVEPNRKFDNPNDTAVLADLQDKDIVTLTGKLRKLQIGSLHGEAILDASKLDVQEIEIGGDVHGNTRVILNAPNGNVVIKGFVVGSAKITVVAPGGTVTIPANSGRLDGGSEVTITAKTLNMNGVMLGGARLNATFTTGGSLKVASMEGGATLKYKKAAASDPAIVVEKGELRGGARVIAE
jgi:hypothetical protein